MKSARAGGSGHAHPDDQMSPMRTPRKLRIGRKFYPVFPPTTPMRKAMKRKANAKRRRRDKRRRDET